MANPASSGVVFCAPVLPPDVTTLAAALEQIGQLQQLVTRWCFTDEEFGWVQRLALPQTWDRRPLAPVSRAHLHRSLAADLRQHLGHLLDRNAFGSIDKSFGIVDAAAARLVGPNTSAVLGREDACLSLFRRAQEFDLPRIYQLPTAHFATVERLLKQERNVFPEAFDHAKLEADFASERIQRKTAELNASTHIFCPSSFVRGSLEAAGIPAQKLKVIPCGTELDFAPDCTGRRERILLYAGTISARKGVHRLIRVWKLLGAYRTHTLRLVGDLHLPSSFVADHRQYFEHVPRVRRIALAREYATAQAFVFNALADGFGHVVTEAMTCGTAVLASRNSGAPDLIGDGEGLLFDFGNDEALARAIDWALSCPQQLLEMGQQGRVRALASNSNTFTTAFLKWIGPIIAGERCA